MTRNPQAAINIPIPIFFGVEGSLPFLARAPKSATEMGVSSTTKGLNCWKSLRLDMCTGIEVHVKDDAQYNH